MAVYGFLGCLLIAGAPSAAIYYTFLRRKPFLALLVLACAFAWLVGLLLISAVFRAFVPLDGHTGILAAALVVGVAAQECMRLGFWVLHRRLVSALNELAGKMEGTAGLSSEDERLLALAQGWAHGVTHAFFFYFSWLPLYAGDATLYLDACPAMSYFLAGALVTAAFALLHTASMVVAFDGLEAGRRERWACVPAAHLAAAALTLANLRENGCLVSIPLLLLLGLGAAGTAGWVCWEDAGGRSRGHVPMATEDMDTLASRPDG